MHLLFLCGCLAALVTAAPTTSPDDVEALEAPFTPRQEMPPAEYQDESEYEDTFIRVPVLHLTPGELEDLLGDMQYRYGEEADLDGLKNLQEYEYEELNGEKQEQEEDEETDINKDTVTRNKRQVAQEAMSLGLSHTDRNGNNRPVGRIHGRFDLNGVRNDRNNHHTQAGLGLGSVLYRSNNGRHSLGVGAYGTQGRGRSYGYGYKTRPQWGAGIGYRFRF